jgi:hypothetical protein
MTMILFYSYCYMLFDVQGQHTNPSPTQSLRRQHSSSTGARYSPSSMASGAGNGRYPTNNHTRETQRAILSALAKLQRDVNNILERLNRLERSSQFLQQVQTTITNR